MKQKRNKSPLFSLETLFFDFVKLTAIPGLLWFRPKLIYENAEAKKKLRGGALIISNHVGFSDPVVLMMAIWYRRLRFICTKEFFQSKWSRPFFRGFLCIPIDRDRFGVDSFHEITDHLRRGQTVTIFPEGGVHTDTGSVGSFKSGMVLMAAQGGVPIVPVCLKRRKHFYNRTRIAIGAPVMTAAEGSGRLPLSKIQEITTQLHDREEALRELI